MIHPALSLPVFTLLLTGVLLNAGAQLLLKATTNTLGVFEFTWNTLPETGLKIIAIPSLWGGLICYGLSLVVWIMGLSRVPVSVAYPILSVGYVLNLFLAHWLLGETITATKISGVFFIMIGVILISRN